MQKDIIDEALRTDKGEALSDKMINLEGLKLEEDELEKINGGRSEQKITTDCYYCGDRHVLTYCTDLKIIPHGLKKYYDGATRYFCTYARKYFYKLQLPNGGIAILDNDMKIVK